MKNRYSYKVKNIKNGKLKIIFVTALIQKYIKNLKKYIYIYILINHMLPILKLIIKAVPEIGIHHSTI